MLSPFLVNGQFANLIGAGGDTEVFGDGVEIVADCLHQFFSALSFDFVCDFKRQPNG